jgi:hypothetical protein
MKGGLNQMAEKPYAFVLFDKYDHWEAISPTREDIVNKIGDWEGTAFTGEIIAFYSSGKTEVLTLTESELKKVNASKQG